MSRDTPAAPRRFRPLIVLLFGALALVLIWLVGSHWLLNSQWLPQRLSTIEGVEVRWTNAQSLHPGRWEVDNLYLAREDEALPITVEASQATLSLSLLALLRGELHIQALEANGIRRFTIGDIALEAEGQLKVEDTQFSQETLSVPYVGLDITQGRLVRLSDQTTLVQDIQLRSTASLDSLSTQQSNDALTEALLDALTAQLAITAQADAWDVFMPYLEALPWLSLAGSGVLEGELALAEGQLQPDSELTLAAPELALSMDEQRLRSTDNTRRWLVADDTPPPHTATGQGRVRLAVEEGQLRFTTQLENVTLADTHPYATNTQLALATHIPNQRLDQLDLPTRASFELSGEVTRLDMLDRYLATAFDGQGVRLSGQGSITASATLQDARPYEASLTVQAPTLGAELLELTAQGSGTLDAALSTKEQITAKLAFTDATLRHQERTLLANAALTLAAQSPLDPEQAQQSATAQLSWEDATLPNIQTLQPYLASVLPSPSPLTLNSGTATSHGQLILTTEQLSGELHLAGNALTTGWQRSGQRGTLVSNTQLTLAIRQAALDGTEMDISGSRLSWQVADPQRPGEALESTLVLRDGRFQRQNATPSGQFTLEGSVQRLGFLNTFLPDAHGVSLSGNGQLFLQGAFIDDTLQAPTRLRVNANQLEVTFLDYLATGRGELTAQLDSPEQAQLSLGIPQFALRRQDDDRPHLEGRHFALTTQTDRFSDVLDSPAPEHFTTRVALPITEVPDIARYNRYLAEDAGVELLSGSASLTSEWLLEGRRAQGDITLRAFETEMALLEQRLRGDVTLHLQLTEGDIETRRFVANDSYLRLENVFRRSDDGTQDAGWWVQLTMEEAQLNWGDPIHLTSQLQLGMRDTGLLARLFLARARESNWLGRLLNVHNINGHALLTVSGEQIRLHDLTLTGGPLLLLSDMTLADGQANGALYARLGAVGLGVELNDSEPALRVLQPKRWFDRWREAQRFSRP
ncbi:hypothetical protein ACXGSL_12195 [Vreelandella aquamarina]|jgi:hypothetical protein|uniref:AsmA-like C-terminal domain-containing protein n=1 Tax=Vreelandella aquamarina TaxID=77097 RepID=A0A6F8SXD3_9GAMM|nr:MULTISPECIES: hypothetical protein [Halomonas]MCC4290984.1 hypothetical protein [Halomonas axialensis]MCF2912056.1 hypothetical protein [Halomonas sp. Cn5-12]BCA92623.1 hypothetical protein HMSLTHF_23980 [Halomonas meridiana]HBN60687.1 hypothetical protein [Halomonas sp.]